MSITTRPPEPQPARSPDAPGDLASETRSSSAAGSALPSEPERRRIGWRLIAGCVVVLAMAAVASAVFVSGQISALRSALSENPSLKLQSGLLANAGFGGPQTLLLVGNDQRNHTTTAPVLPHSNEMLLVRIDPSKPWISMMSIPRELWVPIYPPNAPPVTTRFNYAYTAGGIPLLVSTIKRILGLSVNHVIVIDFSQFSRAVDEIGCVYSTVDRRYFHVNTPTSQQYQEINLQPGYQKLCGTQALQFVSYRHGDTSLVRDARDQSFLLDFKREFGPTLVDSVGKFERIFGQTVQTDPGLHTTSGILNLVGTLISSSRLAVRQVQFQVNLLPTYDTATPQQIAASVHSFLYGSSIAPKRSVAAVAHAVGRRGATSRLQLAETSPAQLDRARAAARSLGFALEYPRVQDAFGSAIPVALRTYTIHAPGGTPYPAYVAVFPTGVLGQYYDVQGMTWTTAPQFDSPNQTIRVARRTYYLDYSGQHLQLVAWYEHRAVYWVHNTLLDSLGNGAMLAIAEQTDPVGGVRPSLAVSLRTASVPRQHAASASESPIQRLGSVGGLITLAAIPLVGMGLAWWRWELRRTRRQLGVVSAQRAALVAATGSAAGGGLAAPTYTRYAASSRSTPALHRWTGLAVAGVVAAAVAIGLVVVTSSGLDQARRIPVRHRTATRALPVLTDPVAVLNATSVPGAAAKLSDQLRQMRVTVAGVGNLTEQRPPGLWILYAPGARTQATELSRLLRARSPRIAPVDPVAQAAAGPHISLVVVIA